MCSCLNKKPHVLMSKKSAHVQTQKRSPKPLSSEDLVVKKAATYSPALHCSTIGANGFNFSVRNGKRWDTAAITA